MRRRLSLGLVRNDIPADLAVELVVAVLSALDRWAVDHFLHSPGGPDAAEVSLHLIQGVVAAQDASR